MCNIQCTSTMERMPARKFRQSACTSVEPHTMQQTRIRASSTGCLRFLQRSSASPPDTLFLSIGCKVRLVKNISVAAGLVNSSTGTVVAIIYDKADVQAILDGKHPSPYCILVCFPNFHGFPVKGKPASAAMTPERQFPFPRRPHFGADISNRVPAICQRRS